MNLSWLFFWKRKPAMLDHLQVRLYTRAGCHLCELAWDQLRAAREQYRFALDMVDVDSDPILGTQYGSCVPVVTVNGQVRFRGKISPVLLQRLLRAERARSPSS